MAKIPEHDPIGSRINSKEIIELPRPYIGYSSLNHECKRFLWYSFRWVFMRRINAKGIRIFERGDIEEARIIRDLKSIDIDVFKRVIADGVPAKIPLTGTIGEAQEELIGVAGHVKGHPDGRCLNIPQAPKTEHLLEMKTMNDKYFKQFCSQGLEKAFPVYWGQAHSYMGKMKLKRGLFVATNKNNEDRKHVRIEFDPNLFKHLEGVAFDILTTEIPPMKIGDTHYFKCRFCEARAVCHKGEEVQRNCRTCSSSCVEDDGKWSCEARKEHGANKVLSIEEQKEGCMLWSKMEGLI